jgi:hypothetical protein
MSLSAQAAVVSRLVRRTRLQCAPASTSWRWALRISKAANSADTTMVMKVRADGKDTDRPPCPQGSPRLSIAGFLGANQSQVGDPLKMLQVAREQRQPVRRRDTGDEVVAHSDGWPAERYDAQASRRAGDLNPAGYSFNSQPLRHTGWRNLLASLLLVNRHLALSHISLPSKW